MAVRLNPTVSSSRTQEYLHTKRTVGAINKPKLVGSDCCFCVPNCDWDYPAFVDTTDQFDTYKNDKTDFIFNVPTGGSLTATLIELNQDNTTKNSFVIVDNTYGDFFATGTVKTGVWAFLLDWYKVVTVQNFGRYKLNIVIQNGSSTEIFNEDSVCFKVEPYSCEAAARTVKIKTEQSGYFEGGFDYTGLDFTLAVGVGGLGSTIKTTWPQEIRLFGRFWRQGRDFTVDNIVTEERGQQMVQSQTIKRYLLKLDNIPSTLSNRVIDDLLQAPEIYISDYQISPVELYEEVRVTPIEFPDPVAFPQNKNEFYDVVFLEWKQDNVHRFK